MLDYHPVWMPDGKSVIFTSDRGRRPPNLYMIPADGGEPERLTDEFAVHVPSDVSRDGRLVFFDHRDIGTSEKPTFMQNRNVKVLDLETREVRSLLVSPANEYQAALSPDGRWLGYMSDESGRQELYIRSFPDMGPKRRITLEGAQGEARWGRDSRTLYYIPRRADRGLERVRITTQPEVTISEPEVVFTMTGSPPTRISSRMATGFCSRSVRRR